MGHALGEKSFGEGFSADGRTEVLYTIGRPVEDRVISLEKYER